MKHIVIVVLLILTCLSNAHSTDSTSVQKEQWKLGASLFPSMYNHDVYFCGLPDIPTCSPFFSSGTGFLGSIGIDFTYNINNTPFAIQSRFDVKGTNGDFAINEEILVDNPLANPAIQIGQIRHTLSTSFSSLGLSVFGNYRVTDALSIGLGTRVAALMGSTFNQKEQLISPDNVIFKSDSSRTRNIQYGSIPKLAGMEAALACNARYTLPLNSRNDMQLIPEIGYEMSLTNVLTTTDYWKVHTLKFGVTIAFAYIPEEEITIPIDIKDPIIIPSIAIVPHTNKKIEVKENLSSLLQAPIKAMLFDSNGTLVDNEIKIQKKVARNMFSIINYVFFDSNSAEIPQRYKRMDKEKTALFSIDDIRSDSALSLYHDVLNILGKRLQSKPNAVISLTGTNSNNGAETNNGELSQKRAEAIKQYLVDVWGIDPSRLKTDFRNLPEQFSRINTGYGEEENRRVEIAASDPDIFLPVKFIDTSYQVIPNDIRINTERLDKQNMKKWELRAISGNQSVVIATGNETMPDTVRANADDLSDEVRNTNEVILKIVSTDNVGMEKVLGETSIPVTQRIANKNKIEKYNLITFGYNSSSVDQSNNFIIQDIKKNISNNSILTLNGYTDKTGTANYNRGLSLRRAQEISRYFKANKIVTQGLGFDEILFPLELPEGRFYSRTVRITVDTYVDDVKE